MSEPAREGAEPHNFDRRVSDVNVSALAVRVASLEGRVESLEDRVLQSTTELAANTQLTKQVHEALHGRGDVPGLAMKVDEMHAVFAAAKGGFKVLEFTGKVAKPLAYITAIFAAMGALFATGHWQWPKV